MALGRTQITYTSTYIRTHARAYTPTYKHNHKHTHTSTNTNTNKQIHTHTHVSSILSFRTAYISFAKTKTFTSLRHVSSFSQILIYNFGKFIGILKMLSMLSGYNANCMHGN